ncbi:MAG: hypothetical protein ABII07_00415 [Patescibacteria group bacterium]|nr:hypothetical protein [Patescibacteria group bacterium]
MAGPEKSRDDTPDDNSWVLDSASLPLLKLLSGRKARLMSVVDDSGEPWPRVDDVDGGVLGYDPILAERFHEKYGF